MLPLFPGKPCSGSDRVLINRIPERRRGAGLLRRAGWNLGQMSTAGNAMLRVRRSPRPGFRVALHRGFLVLAITTVILLETVPSALALTFNGFPTPTGQSNPTVIVPGPDGNLWFTETSANRIGKITPAGVIT